MSKSKKKLFILPDAEDILHFNIEYENEKSKNDNNNKIREQIICSMPYIDKDYFDHEIYGKHWKNLKLKFEESIKTICPLYFKYKIKHMAGRKNNYDFVIIFYDINLKKIHEAKLEFKYNASCVDEAPQFVSPMKPSQYLSSSFEENYYNNYLINLLNKFELTIPEKDTYLKEIHSNKPKCMEESQILYYQGTTQSSKYTGDKRAIDFYETSKLISKECIKEFITNTDLNIEKLSKYLLDSQNDKIYLLYKNNSFYIQQKNNDDYIIESYLKNPNNSRYEAVTKSQKKMNILLRWKNGNGIAYPAFQIS